MSDRVFCKWDWAPYKYCNYYYYYYYYFTQNICCLAMFHFCRRAFIDCIFVVDREDSEVSLSMTSMSGSPEKPQGKSAFKAVKSVLHLYFAGVVFLFPGAKGSLCFQPLILSFLCGISMEIQFVFLLQLDLHWKYVVYMLCILTPCPQHTHAISLDTNPWSQHTATWMVGDATYVIFMSSYQCRKTAKFYLAE